MKINLPIDRYEVAIVNAIRENDFLIVVGQTGCGKTTRIPQFLMNDFSQVIVTEPRILTAKTASYRVAEEMNVTVGKEVGYKTGYDKLYSFDSKILFCTDGLQLVRTITMADGTKENVLVIDEIHLWNINMESLVAWCKFMRDKWNTKVVIMSATMDAKKLKAYLGAKTEIINVPGRLYPVTVEHRGAYMLIPTIIEYVKEGRDTLVFVSGKKKMEEVIEDLQREGCDAVILPLHGELEWEEQKKCYDNYGKPKVIVATNIAQDGVTIPGISVVDTGKANVSNAESGVESVVEIEISKAACKQREGRAGRTEGGRYTLCSDYPYEYRDDYDVPDIQRSILDRIVLQLAAAGLDAEKLEFYHQPDIEAIKLAKKNLVAFGATDTNNNVTELGEKMVKIPVSVDLARMIVAAEKYGVTEQVMTIAAIIEMGGLIKHNKDNHVSYNNFSDETTSDLLTELDVWEKLSEMGYINFKEVGISKRNFLRIKEHIKKLRIALDNLVDIQHNDNRDAILNACLTGMVTNIFVRDRYGDFIGEDGIERQIDNSSCVRDTYAMPLDCVVGKPKMIPWKSGWRSGEKHLISFATKISKEKVEELVPTQIKEKVEISYDAGKDAVLITTGRYYLTKLLSKSVEVDYNHPEYARLKAEYDAEQERIEQIKQRNRSMYNSIYSMSYYEERQRVVEIDGKDFTIEYISSCPVVMLDDETLFKTEVNKVTLDNGNQVMFMSYHTGSRKEVSVAGLRNAVDNVRFIRKRNSVRDEYSHIKICTLQDALNNSAKIGTVELAKKMGGYSDDFFGAYGALTLKKNTVSLELIDDEDVATEKTCEALQYLFMKEVEKTYPIGCFSAQKGKKKKVLTPKEIEMKMEFDSLVKELVCDLNIGNAEENLNFLEEYFNEMSEKAG